MPAFVLPPCVRYNEATGESSWENPYTLNVNAGAGDPGDAVVAPAPQLPHGGYHEPAAAHQTVDTQRVPPVSPVLSPTHRHRPQQSEWQPEAAAAAAADQRASAGQRFQRHQAWSDTPHNGSHASYSGGAGGEDSSGDGSLTSSDESDEGDNALSPSLLRTPHHRRKTVRPGPNSGELGETW